VTVHTNAGLAVYLLSKPGFSGWPVSRLLHKAPGGFATHTKSVGVSHASSSHQITKNNFAQRKCHHEY